MPLLNWSAVFEDLRQVPSKSLTPSPLLASLRVGETHLEECSIRPQHDEIMAFLKVIYTNQWYAVFGS